eukprot:CAMPEP_0202863520 /NCGR_PEP_ID=MMETSP1391-20130828/4129_1 /ASSEMBLY_ACC=CAM_ASM_000867 /TAXON_ID=1034604 /ORGANISM="Chlamydomonas leiostraca, Strain SAG 11-49" /LENGTH=166 /DNA_ID=CAMNT_0049543167 /DNA_START=131 /DNA_END=627 /DNA_ORIENTATION=+
MGRAALKRAVKVASSGSTTTSKNPTCDLVMPVLDLSHSGEMGSPAAASRSPCLNISSSSACTQHRCTSRGALMWPRSAHLSAICSARALSASSSGSGAPSAGPSVEPGFSMLALTPTVTTVCAGGASLLLRVISVPTVSTTLLRRFLIPELLAPLRPEAAEMAPPG